MWEMSNHETAGNLMSVEGKRRPSMKPLALSLVNVQPLGPAGRGPRSKILPGSCFRSVIWLCAADRRGRLCSVFATENET